MKDFDAVWPTFAARKPHAVLHLAGVCVELNDAAPHSEDNMIIVSGLKMLGKNLMSSVPPVLAPTGINLTDRSSDLPVVLPPHDYDPDRSLPDQ